MNEQQNNAGPLSYGADLIKAERLRQIHVLGFDYENDKSYPEGLLFQAGMCYLSVNSENIKQMKRECPPDWPWDIEWWKPSENMERNYVKGCALIAAELDLRNHRKNG